MKYINEIYVVSSVIATTITGFIGGWDKVVSAFTVFIVVDILTGVLKGYMSGNFSSRRMRKGFGSKVGYFIVIVIAAQLDKLIPQDASIPLIRTMCLYFYIFVEGSSIIENLAQMGVPIPKVLIDKLEVIKIKSNKDKD